MSPRTWLAAAFLVGGGACVAPQTPAKPIAVAIPAAPTPTDSAPPTPSPPARAQITREAPRSRVADAAPGRPASKELPSGSIYVGLTLASGEASVVEWDVARARVLHEAHLQKAEGEPLVRVVSAPGRVYAVVDSGSPKPAPLALDVLDADLRPIRTTSLSTGHAVSLDANDRWVAISYRTNDPGFLLQVAVFDARTMKPAGAAFLGATNTDTDALADALELRGERLYVAARHLPKNPNAGQWTKTLGDTKTTVFALDLPMLETKARFDSNASANWPSRLTSDGAHLELVTDDAVIVLDDELHVVRRRHVAAKPDERCTSTRAADRRVSVCSGDEGVVVHDAEETHRAR